MRIRQRTTVIFGGAILVILASLYSDPDSHFLSTILGGLNVAQGLWAVAAAHICRKALMDYNEANQQTLFAKAKEGSVGAGLALVAKAIVFVGLLLVFAPRAHAADLPPNFVTYGPVLKQEQQRYWPTHPDPATLAALVEQESCISIHSKSCWSPSARLKTDREEGAGVGQITRAYNKDGSIRFDSLKSLSNSYGDLGELSWDNVYQRPDLQFRALVLMSKDSANQFRGNAGWLEFGDAGYNGGPSGVQKERRACKLTSGCDPSLWFGHVEVHCLKSRQPLYGSRSACDINREHVKNVRLIRRQKYTPYMNRA